MSHQGTVRLAGLEEFPRGMCTPLHLHRRYESWLERGFRSNHRVHANGRSLNSRRKAREPLAALGASSWKSKVETGDLSLRLWIQRERLAPEVWLFASDTYEKRCEFPRELARVSQETRTYRELEWTALRKTHSVPLETCKRLDRVC